MQQRAGIVGSCQTLERVDLGFAATVVAGTATSGVINGGGVYLATWYLQYTQASGSVNPTLLVLLENGSTVVRTFSLNGGVVNGSASPTPEYHLSFGPAMAAAAKDSIALSLGNFQLSLVVATTSVTLLVTQLVLYR